MQAWAHGAADENLVAHAWGVVRDGSVDLGRLAAGRYELRLYESAERGLGPPEFTGRSATIDVRDDGSVTPVSVF